MKNLRADTVRELGLVDEFMPIYDARTSHRLRVDAPAGVVYEAARHAHVERSPVVRLLIALRNVPMSLSAGRGARRLALSIDELTRNGRFIVLAERPGKEFALGLVGAFWRPQPDLQRVDASDFAAYADKRFAKAVWTFAVEPDGAASLLSTETRVRCPSDATRRRFLLYWRVVGPFSGLIRREILRAVKREAERQP